MPLGPNRAPERHCVPKSKGAPITATSASIASQSRQSGDFPKVEMPTKGRFRRPDSYPCGGHGRSSRTEMLAASTACENIFLSGFTVIFLNV